MSDGMAQRDIAQVIEAWMRVLQTYGPWLGRMGRKFARIAVVDASLIKLSLLAYRWAEYRKQRGAAKRHAVLEWARGIPQQLVVTTGKVHDLRGARPLHWARHWTYIFGRAYLGFDFLSTLLEAGAHFVVRFKEGGWLPHPGALCGAASTRHGGVSLDQRLDNQLAGLGRRDLAIGQLSVARWQVDSGLDRSL